MHALQQAIAEKNMTAVAKCLAAPDVTAKAVNTPPSSTNSFVLISAVKSMCPDIVAALLKAGANPNVGEALADTSTPLIVACSPEFFSDEIARLLIAAGANVNCALRNRSSSLPLISALKLKEEDLVTFLLNEAGASINPACLGGEEGDDRDAALIAAVSSGMVSLVDAIVDRYLNPQPSLNETYRTTITASVIDKVCEQVWDEEETSQEMLDYFRTGRGSIFTVEGRPRSLDSVLYRAIHNKSELCVRYLVDHLGACVNNEDEVHAGSHTSYDIPVLHETIVMHWADGVRLLVNEYGADVDCLIALTFMESMLGTAMRCGEPERFEIVKLLLEAGANPNEVLTLMPLHTAVQHDSLPLVELLMAHGADPFIKDYEHEKTAFDHVTKGKTDPRIIKALRH